jgi:F-type H+-transporting ATPase subunit gamma
MPSVRDLRDRIRSLKNTQQITKAMKQVAAAKIRRAEQAQKRARPYADELASMLRELIASAGAVDHPYMKPGRAGAPAGVILMTADKGLAGAFNANLVRAADLHQRADKNVVWYAVGVKARNGVRRLPQPTAEFWPLSAGSKIETARAVARRVGEEVAAG